MVRRLRSPRFNLDKALLDRLVDEISSLLSRRSSRDDQGLTWDVEKVPRPVERQATGVF